MEIIENRALHLRVRDPSKITSVIPCSEQIGANDVLVRWGLEEAQVLKNMKIKGVPSPILRSYDWPGMYKPFAHQVTTSEFLTLHRRAFCFNSQGTGKTGSVIWAADYLMKAKKIRRVLVLCPVSVMGPAWRGDLFRFAMHRRVDIAHSPTREKRRQVIHGDAEFVIINYDGLEIVADDIIKNGKFDLIVADEANAYKNTNTDRWRTLAKIIQPHTWVWMLTGTPAAQDPTDAFGLAKIINPTGVPKFQGAFRDMVMTQLTRFKWVPKPGATDTVFSVLQPAIRFTKEECLDLPEEMHETRDVPLTKQQNKYYFELLKQQLVVAAGEEISAPTAAANLSKLLQISCIRADTPVLSSRGWVPIQGIATDDLLWDGVEWVPHQGVIYKGRQQVIPCGGVSMTAEHLVLTAKGWVTAQEKVDGESSTEFAWASVRLPDSYPTCGDDAGYSDPVRSLAMPVCVWEQSGSSQSVSSRRAPYAPKKLRMSPRERDTQDVFLSSVQRMARYVGAVPKPSKQRLEELWGAWNHRVQAVAGLVREFLGRHAGGLLPRANAGPRQQYAGVLESKLPMGNHYRTEQQHQSEPSAKHPERAYDVGSSGKSVWDKKSNLTCPDSALWMGSEKGVQHSSGEADVYDIAHCGPRNRFVVRSAYGTPCVVHNCGAVYTDTKEVVEFDCGNRLQALKEVIDEASHKVLVFVPYTHSIVMVSEWLKKKGYTVEIINGAVSPGKRTDIVNRFQTEKEPRVLVIQPQAASHGITLHAANVVVYWSPVMSVETYLQANARVHRAGQVNKVTIVHLQGSRVESKMYKMLQSKVDTHQRLVDLYKEELEGVGDGQSSV